MAPVMTVASANGWVCLNSRWSASNLPGAVTERERYSPTLVKTLVKGGEHRTVYGWFWFYVEHLNFRDHTLQNPAVVQRPPWEFLAFIKKQEKEQGVG